MSREVFYKKFTKKRFGGGSVFLAAHPDEVWGWIEQYGKQQRVDAIKDCIEAAKEPQLFDEHEYARAYIISAMDKLKELNDTDN